jgi:hypothetical protein
MKKAENCIFLLTRGYKFGSLRNYKYLIQRNRLIRRFLKSPSARIKGWEGFELVVFHEGDINYAHQVMLAFFSLKRLKFINIQDDFRLLKTNIWSGQSEMPLKYSLLCQFQYFHVWDYLKSYEIVCRIDEDILVTNFPSLLWEFDFIAGAVFPETHQLTNETLPKFLSRYNDNQYYDHKFPLTNFYVTKPTLWLRPEIKTFLTRIVNFENSANFRWGDIPILGVALHKFMDRNSEIRIDSDIQYFHGSHNSWVRDGVQLDPDYK